MNKTALKEGSKIKAILLMGGEGKRFDSTIPKQFHRLFGKKIYLHTLEALIHSHLFHEIILVCPKSWQDVIKEEIKTYSFPKLTLTTAGLTRQASCFQGLLACKEETQIVVIHDAVRPFISSEILSKNVEGAFQYHAIDTCIASSDTLVFAPKKEEIESIPLREHFLRGQTPQTFSYALILNAHLKAQKDGIENSSDDCSLVLRMGHPVHMTQGSEFNIKITSPLDLILAEQIGRHQTFNLNESIFSSLAGKVFVITGGTGGIGAPLTTLLKQEGAIAIPISKTASEFPTDLTSFSQTQATFKKIHQHYGPIDGLINCIGYLKCAPFSSLKKEDIDLLISTNLTSVLYSCLTASLKQHAHIINIASSSYTRGRGNYAIYSSAKAAIVNFTQALAQEHPNLRINALIPHRTATLMRKNNFPKEDPSTLLQPEDVAKEIAILLKQDHITGCLIEVRKN